VQLVISDAHAGLQAAISSVLIGASWQRCRVHYLRNVLAQVPKGSAEMVAAPIRTIFAQPDAAHVREQLDTIAGMLGRQLPKVETMLRDATEDITAFAGSRPCSAIVLAADVCLVSYRAIVNTSLDCQRPETYT